MPMKPHKGESQSDFMSRCVPEMMGDGKREQDQAVAACMSIYRDNKDKQFSDLDVLYPDDDESHDDFIDRCVDWVMDENDFVTESSAEEACEIAWEDNARSMRGKRNKGVLFKTHAETVNGMEFVLSDETPDRMGDVLMATGWDLINFKKNPIALFNHRSDFPIGKWTNLRVEKGKLCGYLKLAPEGTSDRIDEIRKLIDAGILKAVSVGFRPVESHPRKNGDGGYAGEVFTKSELVETSVVSVPANPNALAVAKSLKISTETMDIVFAEQGARGRGRKRRGANGEQAETSRSKRRGGAMSSLSQRIADSQTRLVELSDRLKSHLEQVDDSNVSDQDLETTTDLNAKIAQERKTLIALQESERQLAGTVNKDDNHRQVITVRPNGGGNGGNGGNGADDAEVERRRQFFQATSGKKELQPLDYLVRAGVVTYLAKVFNRAPEDICRAYAPYSDEKTRAMVDWSTRAAVNPAMTSVTGWAAELVQQVYADFMALLQPKSVFPRLSAMGLSLTFGRAGKIVVPTRSATPTIAGSFVGEGAAIPVRQGAFTSVTLTPKKMAVITTWTKELDEHSIPAIEGLLREAIQQDTAVALDAILLDSNAATTIRPAGIFNGVTPTGATAGGGFAAIVGDLKALLGALTTATKGNLRSPAWLMNPAEVNSAKFITFPTGEWAFRNELNGGTLNGYPVIDSGTVPLKTVGIIDAADFVTVGEETPRFEISDQATLHEEDTNPAAIVPSGGGASSPVRSLWQTDSLALRLIHRLNWQVRRTGVVALTQNVTW